MCETQLIHLGAPDIVLSYSMNAHVLKLHYENKITSWE